MAIVLAPRSQGVVINSRSRFDWNRYLNSKIARAVAFRFVGFPTVLTYVERELSDCVSVLDLGCGRSSVLRDVRRNLRSIGVDAFRPYLLESKTNWIHSDYFQSTVEGLQLREGAIDAVLLLEVLEHIPKKTGLDLIEKLEKWAKKKVIVSTPNGWVEQESYDGNPFQEHKSAWTPDDFDRLGFRCHGVGGLKTLTGPYGIPLLKPRLVGSFAVAMTQKVVCFDVERAFGILAVKLI